MKQKQIAAFWSKIDKTGSCWEWLAFKHPNGYGLFKYRPYPHKQITVTAHRLAWILTKGEIPEGLYACHRCDNRGCCNPAHLFMGTTTDNMQDMIAKGRANNLISNPEFQAAMVERAKSPESNAKRKLTYAKTKHQQGENNSQFGTCWIHCLATLEAKKIKKHALSDYLGKGWAMGKVPKK